MLGYVEPTLHHLTYVEPGLLLCRAHLTQMLSLFGWCCRNIWPVLLSQFLDFIQHMKKPCDSKAKYRPQAKPYIEWMQLLAVKTCVQKCTSTPPARGDLLTINVFQTMSVLLAGCPLCLLSCLGFNVISLCLCANSSCLKKDKCRVSSQVWCFERSTSTDFAFCLE